jgi:Phage gp6-like head-tail connector protein
VSAPQYTTLANLRSFLKLKSNETADDPLLELIIPWATGVITRYLHYDLSQTTYTEVRNGWNQQAIKTKVRPIISVTSVIIGTYAVPAATAPNTPGYLFDQFMIYLTPHTCRVFERGVQNINLVYSAGYAIIPPEIEFVALNLAARAYKSTGRIGMKSQSMNGQTTASYADGELTKNEMKVLDTYALVPVQS